MHGIGDTHEYDGNRAGRRFERYCCLRSWSDQDVGAEGHQVGDGICQSICGLRKAILYGEVLSLYPTYASQRINERKLGLIKGLAASIAYGEKAEPTTLTLPLRRTWRNEQRRSSRNELSSLHCNPRRSLKTTTKHVIPRLNASTIGADHFLISAINVLTSALGWRRLLS